MCLQGLCVQLRVQLFMESCAHLCHISVPTAVSTTVFKVLCPCAQPYLQLSLQPLQLCVQLYVHNCVHSCCQQHLFASLAFM
jgi:hypothetical protein